MNIKLELTRDEAAALFVLADCTNQDKEEFWSFNKRKIEIGDSALEKLAKARLEKKNDNKFIPDKFKEQFNKMHSLLYVIGNEYYKPEKLKAVSQKDYGLEYLEALEQAYSNIQALAKENIKKIKEFDCDAFEHG